MPLQSLRSSFEHIARLGFAGAACFGLLLSGPIAPLAQDSATPMEFPDRTPAPFMSYGGWTWLERHDREEQENPDAVLDAMELKDGDRVADIGCGSGYFTRRIAQRVGPTGKTYGVDIQQEMIDIMERIAEQQGIDGITSVLSKPDDPMLPAGEIDWIILVDVYHEFGDWRTMLGKMHEALAPGGRVALVEYRVEDGTGDHIKPDHRMSVRQVMKEWKGAGFELAELIETQPAQHVFFFEAAGKRRAGAATINQVDLIAALDSGSVEVDGVATAPGAVEIKIRRKGSEPMIVTAPTGSYFKAEGEGGDRVARRDGMVALLDDEWQTLRVRTAEPNRMAGAPEAGFSIEPAGKRPELSIVMFHMQGAGVPPDVEQAAVWIASADETLDDYREDLLGGPLPPEAGSALALLYLDRAGIDVTKRRIWADREALLEGTRAGGIRDWLEAKMAE